MDIPDYFANPDVDKTEWIKRKILSLRWELRRVIEDVEVTAEIYQKNKKDNGETKQVIKQEEELRKLLNQAYDLAIQIRDLS